MTGPQVPIRERLYRRVIKTEGCWLHKKPNSSNGYAHLPVSYDPFTGARYPKVKMVYAHRLAWALDNGRWPETGAVIRHTCDNSACCNPDHLIEGTQQQNVDDRQARSDWVPRRKLSPEQVDYILSSDKPQLTLARELGVSQPTIGRVRRGTHYTNRLRTRPNQRKLTNDQVKEIRRSDTPYGFVRIFGVSSNTIQQILSRKTYNDVV